MRVTVAPHERDASRLFATADRMVTNPNPIMSKKPRVRLSKNGRSKTASLHHKISATQDLAQHPRSGNGNRTYLAEPTPTDYSELLRILIEIRDGNLSVRMPIDR